MSATKKLVFIVDDDPMQVQMMSDHLKKEYPNFDIRGFQTGEEAVNNLPSHPDIVVLDYYLNSVKAEARNGAEILQFIKKEFPEIQVIMVSGQDSMEVAVDTMAYGAIDYVVKGDNQFVKLEHAVNRIFGTEHLKEQAAKYKNMSYVLIAVVALIVILTVVLSVLGVI